jgi:hypothetical protein
MSGFKRHDEKQVDPANVWGDDAFQTLEKYATFLTNALTANTKNFVLNVNGAWGTGKSFFVQRWAADLKKNYPVVEYNAWENDSEDDPLSSLLAVCAESLKEHFTKDQTLIDGIKKKGGRIALRLGGIAAKAGLRKILGDDGVKDVCNLFSPDTENDLIDLGGMLVEEQIKKQQERKSFVNELEALVAKLKESDKLPIFICIDELDRCRPTFAIELLERVKHLFHVDGIKFIISTDTEQLAHSIRAVYGSEFGADTYLHRFFDQTFKLPYHSPMEYADMLFDGYFNSDDDWENRWFVERTPQYTFGYLCKQYGLNLRTQQQIFRRLVAVIPNIKLIREQQLHFTCLCLLAILRVRDRVEYNDFVFGRQNISVSGQSGMWQEPLYATLLKSSRTEVERMLDNRREVMVHITPEQRIENEKLYIIEDWFHNYDRTSAYPKIMELTEAIA